MSPQNSQASWATLFKSFKAEKPIKICWCEQQGLETGTKLYAAWRETFAKTADNYVSANPDKRVKWGGPDMSTRSCIIARQMETWAHAQAIFDVLGQTRIDADRLKNVAHIGVTTYSWSFKVNGLEIWEWNEPPNEKDKQDNKLEGRATEFSQVVTQCRNIGDTSLKMTGEAATKWMNIAQCFAGGAETPPPAGSRHRKKG